MLAKVHYLYDRPTPVGHFVRVGYGGHRQLEALFESGRFSVQRVVIDAARYDAQRDLIDSLWAAPTEVVLDPNVAELSSVGRYEGACRDLAWANKDQPLVLEDFRRGGAKSILEKIADFAVERKVDAILAPTHLIEGARDEWVSIDVRSCELLREALDERGRPDIAIDYQLLIPYGTLRDPEHSRALVEALRDVPFENLWIRAGGFGADATPVGVRRFISSLSVFHPMSKPLVADCVGGLAALAAIAFGAVAGIAHGVAERERFDTRSWRMPRRKGGGGQNGRLYFPDLDRHFKLREAEAIFGARSGRRLLACQDRDCCPRGFEDMRSDPKAHFLTQRQKQLLDLEKMPDLRRQTHFLEHHVAHTERTARQVTSLQIADKQVEKALLETSQRLERMRSVLGDLDQTRGREGTRSQPLVTRPTVQTRHEVERRLP